MQNTTFHIASKNINQSVIRKNLLWNLFINLFLAIISQYFEY